MERLSEKEWKVFSAFGENGLLHIATTSSSIDGIKLKGGTTKQVPYVTRSDVNNGIARFVSDSNYEFGSDDAGCITVGLDTQTAFYQPHKFVTGQNIQVITGEQLNEATAQFLVTTLKEQMRAKFNWGGNGATLGRMKHLEVMLPVDNKGDPDYAYMTLYSTEVRCGMLMKYKNFIAGRLSQLEHKDIPALDEKEWKKFKALGDDGIFDIATTSSSIDGIRLKDGQKKNLPYVTRTDNSNGIAYFVSSENLFYGYDPAGCITVGLDTQTAFWQPHDFVTGQNIQVISGNKLNQYLAQFIVPLLRSQMTAKFNWGGNGATLGRMKHLEIMLPVSDDGKPDYEYMEQYAKNMMLRKYEQYLAFIDLQSSAEEVNV